MGKPMSLLAPLFFIFFHLLRTLSPTQVVYLDENFLDPGNTRDGTYEKPFNKLQDIFTFSTILR